MDIPISISKLSLTCRKAFLQLHDSLRAPGCQYLDQVSPSAVEDDAHRFQLWGGNIGAFQDEWIQSSLQYRLRDASSIRRQVTSLLNRLLDCIKQASAICSNDQPNRISNDTLSDSQESPREVSEIQELFLSISGIVTRLFRLSMMIRNPTPRDRYAKIASITPCDSVFDINHVWTKFPNARERPWLVERLGKANAQRRDYLQYRERHRIRLGRIRSQEEDVTLHLSEVQPSTNEDSKPLPATDHDNTASSQAPASSINETKATTFVAPSVTKENNDDASDTGRTETSYATSTGEASKNTLSIPSAPVELGSDEPFECPYCYTIQCPRNHNAWKKHVLSDLHPYVCTFESCSAKPFSSRREWFDHELQAHRKQWFCCICEDDTPYLSSQVLQNHAWELHGDLLTESQLSNFATLCEVSLDAISPDDCPLCDDWAKTIKERQSQIESHAQNTIIVVTPARFSKHLGNHLEQIALFVLPRQQTEDDSDQGSNNAVPDFDSNIQSDLGVSLGSQLSTDEEVSESFGSLDTSEWGQSSISDSISGLQSTTDHPLASLNGLETMGTVLRAFFLLIDGIEDFRKRTEPFKSWKKQRHDLLIISNRLESQKVLYFESIKGLLWTVVQSDSEMDLLTEDPGGLCWKNEEYNERLLHTLGQRYWNSMEMMGTMLKFLIESGNVLDINVLQQTKQRKSTETKLPKLRKKLSPDAFHERIQNLSEAIHEFRELLDFARRVV